MLRQSRELRRRLSPSISSENFMGCTVTAHLRQHFSQQMLEDRKRLILASGHSNAVCVKSEGEIERVALKIAQNEADIRLMLHTAYATDHHSRCTCIVLTHYLNTRYWMWLSFLCIILNIST